MTDKSEKAANLFKYLSELAKLGVPHIKHLRNYDSYLWFSEIPRDTKCRCIAWNFQKAEDEEAQDEYWLEIPKPFLKAPPDYPGELEAWVIESQVTDSSTNEPQLNNEIVVFGEPDLETGEETTSILKIDDYPHISEIWMSYVNNKWKPWSNDDQVLQRIHEVYIKFMHSINALLA